VTSPAEPRTRVFDAAIGSALLSGVSCAIVEYALTLSRTHHGLSDTRGLLELLIALYGSAALLVGLFEGAVVGGLIASGAIAEARRLVGRVVEEEGYDRTVAAGVIGASASLLAFALWVAGLSFQLVAQSVRQLVASVIVGLIAAASLPLFALLAFPLGRLALPLMRRLPRARLFPASLSAPLLLLLAALAVATPWIGRHLDWRALHLGGLLGVLSFLSLQMLWIVLLSLAGRAQTIRRLRRPAFFVLVALLPLVDALVLPRAPHPITMALLYQASYGGRFLAQLAQKPFDRDHDGYSTLLGGGDCDDHDPKVHPGARDWPDDGIDQNCLGGDAHRRPPAPSPMPAEGGFHFRGNVLFIFIDTLRADRVDPVRTPVLDALAARGARFRRAYAQAPGTSRSFPSLVTSRLPSKIVWDESFRDTPGMLLDNHTIFEVLRDAGYHTVGLASHFYFNTAGVDQGFEEFDNSGALEPAEAEEDVSAPRLVARVERALTRLEKGGRPFAMLLHFAEPHAGYMPHPEIRNGRPAPTALEGAYDEEVSYLDGQLGQLFEILKKRQLDQSTMVVVFSDHGESFGLHRENGIALFRHGRTLHDELLRVPLIIFAPTVAPHTIDQPVMLLDVAPTVLDILGVPLPPSFEGRSLAGALAGRPLAPAPVYAEMLTRPTWREEARMLLDADGRTKVIYRITHPRFEIFDVLADPLEQHELSESRPDLLERMTREMADWLDTPP
jgi:arylsulfatase A-like enzyme